MVKIHCGIEIESEYDASLMQVDLLGYHTNNDDTDFHNFGRYFKSEGDASLRASKFPNGRTAEFISTKFDIDDYEHILKDFNNSITQLSKKNNLKDVLNFNNSTGCHIHISMSTDKGVRLPFKMLEKGKLIKFNTKLLTRIKNELPEVYPLFSKGFYRDYARQRINEMERRCSWNFTLQDISRLEFRSFNLRGVETWEQFYAIFKIVFQEINLLINNLYKIGFSFKSYFSRKDIGDLIKMESKGLKLETKNVILVQEY